MRLIGSGNQERLDTLYSADGAITAGDAAQLLLARSMSRSYLLIQNLHATEAMYVEIGPPRAAATLTSGVVTSVAVTNAGFNFTNPPIVRFLGGGAGGNSSSLGLNQPNAPAPSHVARGHATLSGNAVNAIVVDDGGSGYVVAPYVYLQNSDLDLFGCAVPSNAAGSEVGIQIAAGASLSFNGTCCPTDPIAIIAHTTGHRFLCRWMD